MKISILGSGNIGGNLARLFVKAGHDVYLSNSRGPASLKNFVDELGSKLHPVDVDGAVKQGDVVVVSIHWRALDSLPIFTVHGKIIVDTTNPYKSDGTIYDLGDEISSSEVVKHFPGGSVVKAFNTIWFKHLAETGNLKLPPEERRVIPVAGDDKSAKEKIGKLIEEIGFGPLDTGTLEAGSRFQGVNRILYNKELTVKAARMMIKDLSISR